MYNQENKLETSFVKTKKVKIFPICFEHTEDEVNEFCLETVMLTGKHPKLEFREEYIVAYYFDAEPIEYNQNEDVSEAEMSQTNNYYNTIK
jgi:hypothetical protein